MRLRNTNIVTVLLQCNRVKWKHSIMVTLTLLDESKDEVVFFLSFNRHEVHAIFPANVSCFQPVDFGRFVLLRVSAKEIIASFVREFFRSCK